MPSVLETLSRHGWASNFQARDVASSVGSTQLQSVKETPPDGSHARHPSASF